MSLGTRLVHEVIPIYTHWVALAAGLMFSLKNKGKRLTTLSISKVGLKCITEKKSPSGLKPRIFVFIVPTIRPPTI